MMKDLNIKIAFLILGSFALGGFASAGEHGVGNGGRVYVCYSDTTQLLNAKAIQSVDLVDYVEARTLSRMPIDLGPVIADQDQTIEMIDVALKRLSRLSPQFSIKIKQKVDEIIATKQFINLEEDKVSLSKISDANIFIKPAENCVEVQAAFNKTHPSVFEYKFVFVEEIYKSLNSLNRAGLLLHEAIYNIDAEAGAINSDATRSLVALISSPLFDTISPQTYDQTIRSVLKLKPEIKAKNGTFKWVNQWNGDGVNVDDGELVETVSKLSKVYQHGVLYDFPVQWPAPKQENGSLKYKKLGDYSYLIWNYPLPQLNFDSGSTSGSFIIDHGKKYGFKGLSDKCTVSALGQNGVASVLRVVNFSESPFSFCNVTITDQKNNEVKIKLYGSSFFDWESLSEKTDINLIKKSWNINLDSEGNFLSNELVKFKYNHSARKTVRIN